MVAHALAFEVPANRIASRPPEARGLRRDQVRLLVADESSVRHARFDQLPRFLKRGDLLVVNTSPTMSAAVDGHINGRPVVVHFSTRHAPGRWTIELRQPDASGPILDATPRSTVHLDRGGTIRLEEPIDRRDGRTRLWLATVRVKGGVARLLAGEGRPIQYDYVPDRWPVESYQTVFANQALWPGSAEMPSAGRPFSWPLVRRLRRAGVGLIDVTLHAGVSSQEAHEPPQPEQYWVPAETARAVNHTRRHGGRVIAVGTTVTRALESVSIANHQVRPGRGWTDLVLTSDRPAVVVDGIITGWHLPEASHLALLESVAGGELVRSAYDAAVRCDYLWHEFGDLCLLLPAPTGVRAAA